MTSMYEIVPAGLNGVSLISAPFYFRDERGENIETFHQGQLAQAGISPVFIRDSLSISHRNVLRGLHGDHCTWKLITCLYGAIFLAVVDMRPSSPHYLNWEGFSLSHENRLQVLVPPGFANGHLVLSETAHFFYKLSHDHDRTNQFTVAWNDPAIGIQWPIENPIVSLRDAGMDPTAPVMKLPYQSGRNSEHTSSEKTP